MTTREEQVAAAERIAALNPEWTWFAFTQALSHESGAVLLTTNLTRPGVRWWAMRPDKTMLKGPTGRRKVFHSLAKAISALGLSIKESPDD